MLWKFLSVCLLLLPGCESLSCYQCSSPNGECNTGKCDGTWCAHSVVRNAKDNKYVVRKDCANINVLRSGKDDCTKDTTPDGTDTFNCYCNSQDLCNTNDFFKKIPSSGDISQTGSLSPTQNLPAVGGSSNPSLITGGSGGFGQGSNSQAQQQPFGQSNQSGQGSQGQFGGQGGNNQQGGGGGGGAFGLQNAGSNQGGFNSGQNPQGGFQGQNQPGSNQGGFGQGQTGQNQQGQSQGGSASFGLSNQGNGGFNNQQPNSNQQFGNNPQNPNNQGGFGQPNSQNQNQQGQQGQSGQFGGASPNNQNNPGQVTCYQCRSDSGDCTTGSCVGSWCTITSMKHDQSGVNQVVKGCELRDNPFGESRDLCRVNQQPGNMGYSCACKTSDNCNSKENSERLVQAALQSGPSNAAAGGTGGANQPGFIDRNQGGVTGNPQYTVSGRPGFGNQNRVYSHSSHPAALSVLSILLSLCLACLLA